MSNVTGLVQGGLYGTTR